MEKQRRYSSPEFKAEAVKLVTERGYSVAQACRELSIGETAFRRWLAQIVEIILIDKVLKIIQ